MGRAERVNQFLDHVVGTLGDDLKQMMSQPQGLDFGMIMLVCSGIELMGALDRGTTSDDEVQFTEALQKYFPSRYGKYPKRLYRLFRHGLAHQAFIKPGTATARNASYRQWHLWGISVDGEIALFVHPDVLAEDFLKAVERFRQTLRDRPEKVEVAYQIVEKFCKAHQYVDEPIEILRTLPESMDMTRMPLPNLEHIARSEARVGSVDIEQRG